MMTTTDPALYKRHHYPTEIISHAVWLYFRFTLSYRDVEELLAARGSGVSYETIRQWCLKFGQLYANQLRRRRPQTGDKREIMPGVEHRQHKGLNNRAENSHQPARQ